MTRVEFATLALSYLEEVTSYARNLSRMEWEADDLVQEAYERALSKWKDLREPARCRAWLFRIVRNLHVDRTRARSAHQEIHLVQPCGRVALDSVVPPETVERLAARELKGALQRLPEEQCQAVLLSDLWGFRYDEIAEITDVPIGTVRSRIARGRAALARLLASGGRYESKLRGQP